MEEKGKVSSLERQLAINTTTHVNAIEKKNVELISLHATVATITTDLNTEINKSKDALIVEANKMETFLKSIIDKQDKQTDKTNQFFLQLMALSKGGEGNTYADMNKSSSSSSGDA